MLNRAIVVLSGICTFAGDAASMPAKLTVSQFLEICRSSTVAEATAKGDLVGWPRMSEAQTRQWRSSFHSYNGGRVEVTGWKRGERDTDGSLSFWIATGPNGHKACSHSAAPDHFLEGLTEQLGAPASLDGSGSDVTASWQKGAVEAYLVRSGSIELITMTDKN
jgi:hypothetical protein